MSAPCGREPSTSRAICCRWRPTLRWERSSTRARWRTRSRICCRTRIKKFGNLGELLKQAATSPAYNVNQESLRALVEEIRAASPELGERAEQELLREVRVAPTLVKYADPNLYEIETRANHAGRSRPN